MESQREIPIIGLARTPKHAPMDLVQRCRHRLDAIRLCVQLSTLTNSHIAEALGIDKGHWSRIMQGQAHFPDTRTIELMDLCGNFAPVQWEAWATGHDLVERSKDQRIRELESQLAELRGAA